MPYLQTATTSMNGAFGAEAIGELGGDTVELYRPGQGVSLSDALQRTPLISFPDGVVEYINGWPSALQTCIQAAIFDNLTRDARVPITFAWTPGYDYSVTIYDVVDTETSRGGMTVLLTSRYPADRHPIIHK